MSRWPDLLASRAGVAGVAVAGGGLLALALPPFGFWPLAIGGMAILDRLLADAPPWSRFRRGFLLAAAVLVPTLAWMAVFTPPGYVLAVLLFAAMYGTGAALVPASAPGRWLALPALWALVEAVRGRWPFGGVPVSTLAIGQAGGPLAPVVRVGGTVGLALVVGAAGIALGAATARRWRPAATAATAVALALALAAVAPRGHAVDSRRVAVVQGGGPQGTRAEDTAGREVLERHLIASSQVTSPVDLVLWPEDVVDVEGPVETTPEGDELAALARRLGTTVTAGVVEGIPGDDDHFRNAHVAIGPDGTFIDRYDKVRRVPFGEYVPFRSVLERVAPDTLVDRDAVPGDEPAVLTTPAGRFGVAISWEVFFPDRGRDAIGNGGQVLLNPTNGASFTGTLVQTQQVASSRLQALATGRWVLQAAPTGFSAVIDPGGNVRQRTGIGEQRVLFATVERRDGQTWATRAGDRGALGVAAVLAAGGWLFDLRRGPRSRPATPAHDVPPPPS
ncbi:MAG: apolipoprotein N-acyltransferase [Acidimicrobiia bacterium]